ncbi:hypothetical protein ACFSVK_07015 [Azorhizophilus paspali]|uniref:hypothetical protein n=1 Tax=Azorhizophilus paspali TaxID=69963 RepID=UPI0036435C23
MKHKLFLSLIAVFAGAWLGMAPAGAADQPQVIRFGLATVGKGASRSPPTASPVWPTSARPSRPS